MHVPLNSFSNLENVKLLIERGASLRHHSHQLITPLHLACLRESLSLVQLLVEYGADPNQAGTTGHVTPLDLSVGLGYREISRYLLMHGAKANRPNGKGTTTAHLAVEADDLSFLRLLAAKAFPSAAKTAKACSLSIMRRQKVKQKQSRRCSLSGKRHRLPY